MDHVEESCLWLNVLFARHFLEIRRSEIYKKKLQGKFQTKLRNKLGTRDFVVSFLNL